MKQKLIKLKQLKYFSISDKSADPVRHSNTTIVFDRVDYRLLPHDFTPAVNVATWTANATYPRYSYVVNNGIYYQANTDISGSSTLLYLFVRFIRPYLLETALK